MGYIEPTFCKRCGEPTSLCQCPQCPQCLCNRYDALREAIDALGVAIADAGYAWTPAMRKAYESVNPK
jgi:hypothetical protein